MPSLKDIRLRIKSVQTTQQTTKAMKMVAASKLRRAQDLILALRPYARKQQELLRHIVQGAELTVDSPYLEVRPVKRRLIVLITSNRGLCGGFNSGIFKHLVTEANEQFGGLESSVNLYAGVGRKGYESLSKMGLPLWVNENIDLFASLSFARVQETAQQIMQGFVEGQWDEVWLYYNQFKNVATQVRTGERLLPVRFDAPHGDEATAIDYIFEPDQAGIVTQLIPQILQVQFYRAILESNASEHGARMVAMDNATENASELIRELRLSYNKARQAAITKEILEIVAGANALSG
jgi:F-type H+-transporting ATPase subunit gamma